MCVFSLYDLWSGVAHEEPQEVAGNSQEHLCCAWKSPVSPRRSRQRLLAKAAEGCTLKSYVAVLCEAIQVSATGHISGVT